MDMVIFYALPWKNADHLYHVS